MSAVWASQKIMEHSERWRTKIEPAQPVNISPELKVLDQAVLVHTCRWLDVSSSARKH